MLAGAHTRAAMRGRRGELPAHGGEIAETAKRFGTRRVGGHAEPLQLLGARGEVGRDLVVQLALELIGAKRRMPEEAAKAAAHRRNTDYAGLREPRMMPSSRFAYSVHRAVSAGVAPVLRP